MDLGAQEDREGLEVIVVNIFELEKLQLEAQKKGETTFIYKGLELLTEYSKYLIEYAKGQGKTSFRMSKANLPKK